MTRSQVITDAWDVTKAILARLAEWVLFGCMVMNIIEILPGVVLDPFVSNLVLSVQAVTLDVAGFGLASMADHARDNGDLQAARTGKITGWLLIGLMIVTLLLVSIGLLWPQTQPFTVPAEKGLILARVIMTVIYSHVVHSLRRSSHTPQAIPAAAPLDYTEIARHLYTLFPPPAPQIDYPALAQQLVPLMPTSQVDDQALKEQLEATCKAAIQQEIAAMRAPLAGAEHGPETGTGASLRPRIQGQVVALEPSARATSLSHLVAPEPLAGATPRSHLLASAPLAGATPRSHVTAPAPLKSANRQSHLAAPAPRVEPIAESQPEPVTGATEERLQAAYRELTAEGGRVSGRALAARARCNRTTATEWLQRHHQGAEAEPEPQADSSIERQPESEEASA